MKVVELKRIGPKGSGVPSPFANAVLTGETPGAVRYYRLCRPDLEYTDLRSNIVIREAVRG